MRRVMLFDRYDSPLGELAESEIFTLVRREEINGEHALEITTTRVLGQGWRILTQDGRGIWREHVVYGTDAKHEAGERPIGTYYCTWSLQPDLMGTQVSRMPGVLTPVSAGVALENALSGTSRWVRGTVTNTNTGGASMYDTDGWSAMSTLIETWGGELDTTIEVGMYGVTARKVDLYNQQGNQTALRRFDFGADLMSVQRIIEDSPIYCRISPRGKGEETEGGGYGRKITIKDVNDGKDYLENADMVDLAKLPDGSGGWEYPTVMIENSECETPAELLVWAQGVLEEYTVPRITYEVDVLQLAAEGVDMHGVSLGDTVHIVDKKFNGVRVSGRVVSMVVNMLDESDVQLTIGHIRDGFTKTFGDIANSIGALNSGLTAVTGTVMGMNGGTMSTADYLSRLIDRLNDEINATGGYTYITEGYGIRTYDRAVTNPNIGAEATAVVEIRGGSIRIANTKSAQGNWQWKTVFTSGHIASEVITAINVNAGRIQSADGTSYWNLDDGGMALKGDFQLMNANGSGTFYGILGDMQFASQSQIVKNGTYRGFRLENFDTSGNLQRGVYLIPKADTKSDIIDSSFTASVIGSTNSLLLQGDLTYDTDSSGWNTKKTGAIWFGNKGCRGIFENSTAITDVRISSGGSLNYWVSQGTGAFLTYLTFTPSSTVYTYDAKWDFAGKLDIYGSFKASGTKSRLVETQNYGERLLYCYETPAPLFGDIGSGTLDERGECIISLDDVFSETVRTDMRYQVFLQACGRGELWVDEKQPTHFVVRGTPGLSFDWEVKCHQKDYETLRLDDDALEEAYTEARGYGVDVSSVYEESDNVGEIERLYKIDLEGAENGEHQATV